MPVTTASGRNVPRPAVHSGQQQPFMLLEVQEEGNNDAEEKKTRKMEKTDSVSLMLGKKHSKPLPLSN